MPKWAIEYTCNGGVRRTAVTMAASREKAVNNVRFRSGRKKDFKVHRVEEVA